MTRLNEYNGRPSMGLGVPGNVWLMYPWSRIAEPRETRPRRRGPSDDVARLVRTELQQWFRCNGEEYRGGSRSGGGQKRSRRGLGAGVWQAETWTRSERPRQAWRLAGVSA